jgi:hypothetical protein
MDNIGYRLTVGFGVPIVLALFGILAKKLTRAAGPFRRTDFYLGTEFALAGVSAALVNIFGFLLNPAHVLRPGDRGLLLGNFLLVVFGLLAFIFVISMRQQYENAGHTGAARREEIKMLTGWSNALGGLILLIGCGLISS